MSDETAAATEPGETDALLSRLRVIEDQPLDTRAEAFVQIHDRLRATLEGSDSPIAGGPQATAG
ncbi:hypothetical protein [Lacisediminihabitans changchengi]|uniref:Uncharacterized protein n=1 Tax=Lacisediminihabitans changchengi TaxID=2787634 RepID=A0A934SRE7_9MICO|nr:hypothetical protein [Lacisediminihabitans changchengi]MBK4347648.1 hypothetical protein [Lacisediminihabitans changchengi]